MRTATTIEASAGREAVEFAVQAEKLGLDVCWVAGVDTVRLYPAGDTMAARLDTLARGIALVRVL